MKSMASSSANKRRRVCEQDNDGSRATSSVRVKVEDPQSNGRNAQPDETHSTSPVASSTINKNTEAVLLVPQLDVLAQLLTVDLAQDNAANVARALTKLAELLRKEASECQQANQLGAAVVVLTVMRKFQHHKGVQKDGCSCICLLAFACQNDPHGRNTLLQCGAVEAALNAMSVFPSSQGVQKQACYALMNTLSPPCGGGGGEDDDDMLGRTMQRFVLELNGIARVVQTMKDFSTATEIQVAGCGLLGNLATRRAFHNIMREARAVGVVAAALEDHAQHPSIVVNGNKVMVCLFSESSSSS